jgi:carbonic anhydrase
MDMPEKTLKQLLEGNRRFVENKSTLDDSESRRKAIASEQNPFAIVLGCVDSRVPPELIFDQGLGELFVVRTAGEVLDKAVLGSMEFGVDALNIPLIVVLGHKNCGAIKAASEILHNHKKARENIEYLVEELALARLIWTGQSARRFVMSWKDSNCNPFSKRQSSVGN